MKKILSLVLVFALAFVSVLPAFALSAGKYSTSQTNSLKKIQFVTEYESDTPNVKVVGRTNPAYPLLIGYHGSGVEFKVTGTEVVGVRIQSYNTNSHSPIPLYFEINGKQVVVEGADKTTQGTYDYIIKNDLNVNTTYNVKVLLDKENWAQYAHLGFYITHAVVDNNSTAKISKADEGDHKILVFGDSITSAENIGGVHLSYHQLMAKNFNADTQVMSAGGGLFAKNYKKADGSAAGAWHIKIGDDWNSVSWVPTTTASPPSMDLMHDANGDGVRDSYETDPNNVKFPADLVFINIGTNDGKYLFGSDGGDYAEENRTNFTNDFYAMLDEMLGYNTGAGYYPNATVVLSYNLMGEYPIGMKNFYKELVSAYLAMHPELVGSGPNGNDKVTVFFFTPCGSTAGTISSSDKHPNTASHAYAGEELTTFLADYMGWEVKPEIQAFPNNNGVLEELPEVEEKADSLFLGFTDDNDSYVKKGGTIAWGSYIYSKYLNVTLGGKVVSAVNENDPNPIRDMTATYTNGFYIQGAQVRVGLTPQDKATGLRFIVVNNTEIKTALETAITNNLNYERGVMVISGKKYKGGALEVNTENATKVEAKNIFASTTTLQANYDKYTACIINIPEEHFSTQVLVRPYFKYTDNSGVEHVYYGEQYSCSLFAAAKAAYGKESDAVNEYLYNTIISKCKGDNDTQIQF